MKMTLDSMQIVFHANCSASSNGLMATTYPRQGHILGQKGRSRGKGKGGDYSGGHFHGHTINSN